MSTTQESATESKVIGQVKWFNIKAGYGFITLVEGEHIGKDIFVHYSSLKVVNSQYRYLVQGEYVEFHLVKLEGEKYEYHAVDVSGIKGGSIMCEARRSSANARQEEGENKKPPTRNVDREEQGFEKVIKKRQPRAKTPAA